jgi:hypothetical protein
MSPECLLLTAGVLSPALTAPILAVRCLTLARATISVVNARQQCRAHLLLYLSHPVCQWPHFSHVHHWQQE